MMSLIKGGKKMHTLTDPGREDHPYRELSCYYMWWYIWFSTQRLSVPPPSFQQCGLWRVADELLLCVIDGEQRLRVICLNEPPRSDSLIIHKRPSCVEQAPPTSSKQWGGACYRSLHPSRLPPSGACGQTNWSNIDSVCMKGTHGNQCVVVELFVFKSSLRKHKP